MKEARWRHALLVGALLAASQASAQTAPQPAEAPARSVPGRRSPRDFMSGPVVFAKGGEWALVLRRDRSDQPYVYARRDPDGVEDLYASRIVDEEVFREALGEGVLSADGARLIALRPRQAEGDTRDGPLGLAIVERGKPEVYIEPEWSARPGGWAGDAVVFLDVLRPVPGSNVQPAYKLKLWRRGEVKVVNASNGIATSLRVSPDARKGAFEVVNPVNGRILVRVVDLASGSTLESERFMARGALHWDARSTGVFVTRVTHDAGLLWHLARFDLASGRLEQVAPGVTLECVLDEDFVGATARGRSHVVRIADGAVFPFACQQYGVRPSDGAVVAVGATVDGCVGYLVGCSGRRAALFHPHTDDVVELGELDTSPAEDPRAGVRPRIWVPVTYRPIRPPAR